MFQKYLQNCLLAAIIFSLNSFSAFSQSKLNDNPKIVVGIVVDQMGYGLLHKFKSKYGEKGFNRLINEGFNFENHNFNYIPTVTAAGHASIYTGTTPRDHGIINNTWYSREIKNLNDNVRDPQVRLLGIERDDIVGSSPHYLMVSTIGDELKKSNENSKVVSVSLKDRAAILPGGKMADAAYWYDWHFSPGNFVSSSFYFEEVPKWVEKFNEDGRASKALDSVWNTVYPIESYTESAPDDNSFERAIGGKPTPTFPYNFPELREVYRQQNAEYQLLLISPAGNSMLTEFGIQAIEEEKLGKDKDTDLFCISYSVTDVIGHTFGPQSVEMEDVMIRLDKEIEKLLDYLDDNFGQENYTAFITSDHGAGPPASQLAALGEPTGVISNRVYQDSINYHLAKTYGLKPWVEYFETENLFLRRELIEHENLDLSKIQKEVANYLLTLDGIAYAIPAGDLNKGKFEGKVENMIQNGFYPDRSGDVMVVYDHGTIQTNRRVLNIEDVKGSVHGSPYEYDTHVPLIWFGKGIKKGTSAEQVAPTDIAPTLAKILKVKMSESAKGKPLMEIFE